MEWCGKDEVNSRLYTAICYAVKNQNVKELGGVIIVNKIAKYYQLASFD
jgi:hypothetical protein